MAGGGAGRRGPGGIRRRAHSEAALKVPYREREQSVTSSEMAGPGPTDRRHGSRARDGAADHQHRAAPPRHPRRAAAVAAATARPCSTSSRSSATCTPASRSPAGDQEYWKAITFVERMDYLAYYFNAYAYCSSVEALLDEEVPPRAQYLRVIHMELNRIASHLFWLGTAALDIGASVDALVGAARARRLPRPVRDVGRPAPAHALLPGGGRGLRTSRRASEEKCQDQWPASRPASTSTRRCSTATRSGCSG
ncbi:MAG: hypothetical protein WKF40_05695 [Thermoleophilaceae bacterium]